MFPFNRRFQMYVFRMFNIVIWYFGYIIYRTDQHFTMMLVTVTMVISDDEGDDDGDGDDDYGMKKMRVQYEQ